MTKILLENGERRAFDDLVTLTSFGSRFHGTEHNHAAAAWLDNQLRERTGVVVARQSVSLPGWVPGTAHGVEITGPGNSRSIEAWPLLGSGSSDGVVEGQLEYLGPEGLWGDSMTWDRFAVVDSLNRTVGYLLGRNIGPAAPQPLPTGSNEELPHLAIGHHDSLQIRELLDGGDDVTVRFECESRGVSESAQSDNLIVDFPAIAGSAEVSDSEDPGVVLICAHYDTYYNTVGAYDNGSGTIALLHLAERIAQLSARPHIRLLFTTAEEWHLGGARAYVAAANDLDELAYVFNVDGLGRGSFAELFAGPEKLADAFSSFVHRQMSETRPGMTATVRFPPQLGTDDGVFYRSGIPTVYMTVNDLNRLHQPDDVAEPKSAQNIEWAVDLVLDALKELPTDITARPIITL
jgi:hypothetical protein